MSNDAMNRGAILHEAQKLNSDLGRHVRRCSFSNNLTGRFYERNSMQSHQARAQRIAQMKAKRKELEKSLILEDKKISFLEEELRKKKEERRRQEKLKILMELKAIKIQSHVRKMLALEKVEVMTVEREIMNHVVNFIQRMFRGRRDRKCAWNLRQQIVQRKKEELASIQIQCLRRRVLAKRHLSRKRNIMKWKMNNAARHIQACLRGRSDRKIVLLMKRTLAVIRIQSMWRVKLARHIANDERQKIMRKKKEKPKRVPLHERRYSTYAVDDRKGDIKRRLTDLSTVASIRQFNEGRRRSSLSTHMTEVFAGADSASKSERIRTVLDQQVESHKVKNKADAISSLSTTASLEDEIEKVQRARQRASMRAAKLKKQGRIDDKKKAERLEARKEELLRLEEKRRSVLKKEMVAKKPIKSNDKNKLKPTAGRPSSPSMKSDKLLDLRQKTNAQEKVKGKDSNLTFCDSPMPNVLEMEAEDLVDDGDFDEDFLFVAEKEDDLL